MLIRISSLAKFNKLTKTLNDSRLSLNNVTITSRLTNTTVLLAV